MESHLADIPINTHHRIFHPSSFPPCVYAETPHIHKNQHIHVSAWFFFYFCALAACFQHSNRKRPAPSSLFSLIPVSKEIDSSHRGNRTWRKLPKFSGSYGKRVSIPQLFILLTRHYSIALCIDLDFSFNSISTSKYLLWIQFADKISIDKKY